LNEQSKTQKMSSEITYTVNIVSAFQAIPIVSLKLKKN